MKVEFKTVVWESMEVPEEIQDEVKAAVNKGEIKTQNDLAEYIDNKGYGDQLETETLFETKEDLTPEENNNQPTLQVYDNSWDFKPSVTN